MSKAQRLARLKEIIRELIKKNLAEVSTTATAGIDGTGTGHYDTPRAFASGSQGGHKSPEVGGYKKVNERLSVDPRKVYGGTGAKQGMVLTAQKGLKKILDLSKKNPSNVFLVSDDNYTNFGPYYVKNGKVAKYTVANPNYDLQKNKVRSLKVPSDVILKFTINESINESYARMFIEIGKAINASKADDLNAIKDLGEEYDIGRVLYMARKAPRSLRKAVDDRIKERKQFIKSKKLKELKEGLKIDFNHRNQDELEAAIAKLELKLQNKNTLITLSELGVFINSPKVKHHAQAHHRDITDVSGAGDTVISVATLCLALDQEPEMIAELSNLAGGLVCENVGVVPVDKFELLEEAIRLFT